MNLPTPWKEKYWGAIAGALARPINTYWELEKTIDGVGRSISSNRIKAVGVGATFQECVKRHPDTGDFITKHLPTLQRAVLSLGEERPKLQGLVSGRDGELVIERALIYKLLAGMLFCVFDFTGLDAEYDFPDFSMRGAYRANNWKLLRFLIAYFVQVAENPLLLAGSITITRRSGAKIDWEKCTQKVGAVTVHEGKIEDSGAEYLVDFANKYIGGGVLRSGSVQEEILFMICPELLATRLFCQRLGETETLLVRNVRRYSNYDGYSRHLMYHGKYLHPERTFNFTCMDAKPAKGVSQFVLDFERDLNKAACGFALGDSFHVASVASGNWGCGAFGGNPELKCFQQIVAAAYNGVYLQYWLMDASPDFVNAIRAFLEKIRGRSVSELITAYRRVTDYNRGVFDGVVDQLGITRKR